MRIHFRPRRWRRVHKIRGIPPASKTQLAQLDLTLTHIDSDRGGFFGSADLLPRLFDGSQVSIRTIQRAIWACDDILSGWIRAAQINPEERTYFENLKEALQSNLDQILRREREQSEHDQMIDELSGSKRQYRIARFAAIASAGSALAASASAVAAILTYLSRP